MDVPIGFWVAFCIGVAILLLLDLKVFNRKAHKIETREALLTSMVFIGAALVLGVLIWFWMGPKAGALYLTGYLVEESLSVDNLFVFAVLFRYFRVPPEFQHRVLFWGIFGAVVMRAIMIFAGVALIREFHWLLYVFGAFLIFSGVKMLKPTVEEPSDFEESRVLRFLRRVLPVAPGFHGQSLVVRQNGKLYITRLMLVLIMVELTDVVFALDSIPAILGITTDTFIVFTSNIMAIIGLRSLYFLLANIIERFRYLHYGLSLVLIFIGAKMLGEMAHLEVPIWLSLIIITGLLLLSVVFSLVATRREAQKAAREAPPPVESELTRVDEGELRS